VKRVIAPKALDRFKSRVREIIRRANSVSMETTIRELVPYIRGWHGYFGSARCPRCWLVCLVGSVESTERYVVAVEKSRAGAGQRCSTGPSIKACQQHGRQGLRLVVPRPIQSPLVGLSNAYFKSLGLPSLIEEKAGITSRTAGWGPACPVVFLWGVPAR
jgi:RNA-directed DNA polymerase